MDKKITELKGLDQLTGAEYLVVASRDNAENYKVKISDFTEDAIDVDSALSETSKNPVQNKVITEHINKLEDRLEEVEDTTGRLLNLHIAQVETVTLGADEDANVEIYDLGTDSNDVKNIAFKFSIPRGATGIKGEQGITGVGGRTIFAFTSCEERPDKPQGGSWDPITNIITYPVGWSPTDDLVPPIWMSNATFNEFMMVIDWSEPIQVTGADGAAGADAVSLEFIYKRVKDEVEGSKLEKPENNSNLTDFVPDGWEDHPMGVSETMLCEYVCTRSKDTETDLWNDWTEPALWSKYGANGKDGDGVEYIYKHTQSPSAPSNPTPSDITTDEYQSRGEYEGIEYVPSGWDDNPQGISDTYPYEWVCVRKRKQNADGTNTEWGGFSNPTLWAKWGFDGSDGDDGTSIIIKGRLDSTSQLPSSGSVGDTYVINGYLYVWDGDSWTNCGQFKGDTGDPGESMYVHIKFSDDGGLSFTEDPTNAFNPGEMPGKYIGMYTDTVSTDSTDVDDYKPWIKFNGDDGFGYEYAFTRTTTFSAPDVPTTSPSYNAGSFVDQNGITWTDNPTGVDVNTPYEWSCFRTSNANGEWGSWRGTSSNSLKAWLFAMYAESVSIPGDTGNPGPVLYPAGEYVSGQTYDQSVNDNGVVVATPYVTYEGGIYVLIVTSSSADPSDSSAWKEMDKFDAVYTEILLADKATVGNACFYGNYMFSKQGEGNLSDFDYQKDPYASDQGFKPNWCVDLVTGEMWTGCGTTYFNNDGTGHIGDWYLRNVEGSGVSLEGVIGTGKNAISLMPWSGIKVTGTEYGEAVSLNIDGSGHLGSGVQWNADGSGSLANGAIQWDKDGNITVYPKSEAGTATISGEWNDTNYSEATVRISISSNYGAISECKVILYDYAYGNGTIGEVSFNASAGSTFSDTIQNAAGIPCWAQLHINGEMVAENQLLPYVSK